MTSLILNGSFVGHAGGWYLGAHTPDDAHTAGGGRGALSVAKVTATTNAQYAPGGHPLIDLAGLAELDAVAYVTSADTGAACSFLMQFYADLDGTAIDGFAGPTPAVHPSAASWTEVAARGIPVPEGATAALVLLRNETMSGDPVVWSDVYVGTPAGDAAPYAAAAAIPVPANRLPHGDFEGDVLDWDSYDGDEDLTLDTAAPIAGTTSLKVVTNGAGTDLGTLWPKWYSLPVVPGDAVRFAFKGKGVGIVRVGLAYRGFPSSNVEAWSGDMATNPVVSVDGVVPAGAQTVGIEILTIAGNPASRTFWVDDVSYGPVPAFENPAPAPFHGRDTLPPGLTERAFPGRRRGLGRVGRVRR